MPSLNNIINPPDRTGRGSYPSIWRGLVVNITAHAVWVRVPTLASDDLTAVNTVPGDIAPGDRVIIGAVEGRVDNLVVIAKENPEVPAHTHLDTQIQYPGWTDATLTAPWVAGSTASYYPGLRYRTDSRFLYLHGTIAGGTTASTVADLPVDLAYASPILALNSSNALVSMTINPSGLLYANAGGTLRVNATAPLT